MISLKSFTSSREDWGTPRAFFNKLDAEFHFTLDAAASAENHKCADYFSKEKDAFIGKWESDRDWGNGTVWCNPPYGRDIARWIKKAHGAALQGATVVMLLPSRTDTKWFHELLYGVKWVEIRFIKGRLTFEGAPAPAPFPSMLAIFRPYPDSP